MRLTLCVLASLVLSQAQASIPSPNIVFLICESIDGRMLNDGSPIPFDIIADQIKKATRFSSAYVTSPVCAPR